MQCAAAKLWPRKVLVEISMLDELPSLSNARKFKTVSYGREICLGYNDEALFETFSWMKLAKESLHPSCDEQDVAETIEWIEKQTLVMGHQLPDKPKEGMEPLEIEGAGTWQ